MQITVSGKNIDVGQSLRQHIEDRLAEGINKYLDRVNNVMVVITKEGHLFKVDINANTGTHAGIVVKSTGYADEVYASFDAAADKIEKQLRRYKRRITNHHSRDSLERQAVKARKFVIEHRADELDEKEDSPVIIAEKSTDIERLTVSQAVMKMDLSDLPALLFFNSATGKINVVYRRVDGNISWVAPDDSESGEIAA
jgi:ribosomal subunit interface protein